MRFCALGHDKNSPWENIRVARHCDSSWDAMPGDSCSRICGDCGLPVYDLSTISEREAEELILRTELKAPTRFFRRSDGTIMTTNCPIGQPQFEDSMKRFLGIRSNEKWKRLAATVGGTFVDGGVFSSDKVRVFYKDWTLTLDVLWGGDGEVMYNRLRAAYFSADRFRFTVYRRSFITDIAVALGMQDIIVGHPQFDRDFIIKANDSSRVRQLFANSEITDLLWVQEDIRFEVLTNTSCVPIIPTRIDQLCCTVHESDLSLRRLEAMFVLVSKTLDQLHLLGSVGSGNPGVEL
jgi:hypothetical protein